MRILTPVSRAVVVAALWCLACDDTARAVKEEGQKAASTTEKAAEQAKRDLADVGARLKEKTEQAADDAKRAVDEADKAIARELRGDPTGGGSGRSD
jgi:ElaB/YqjD/DUF883 family membrane-anchored ribosome-binding protein